MFINNQYNYHVPKDNNEQFNQYNNSNYWYFFWFVRLVITSRTDVGPRITYLFSPSLYDGHTNWRFASEWCFRRNSCIWPNPRIGVFRREQFYRGRCFWICEPSHYILITVIFSVRASIWFVLATYTQIHCREIESYQECTMISRNIQLYPFFSFLI